jgi:hypothetical protein
VYRIPAPGQPSVDPLLVVPGDGLCGILVGRAIADEVLSTFGDDAQVHRHDDGDVFKIAYDYTGDGEYAPDRARNRARPSAFLFQYGLLRAIEVGVYQSDLHTTGGIHVGSTRDDVYAVFGRPCERLVHPGSQPGPSDDIETMRYRTRGIELSIHHDARVKGFVVFQTRR